MCLLCSKSEQRLPVRLPQSELKLSQHLYVPHYAPTNTEKDANWQRILDMRAANVDASATPTPSPQTQTPLQLWSHWHQSPHPLPTSWQELPIDPDNHPIVGNYQEHELIPVGMTFRKTNGSLYTRGKFLNLIDATEGKRSMVFLTTRSGHL